MRFAQSPVLRLHRMVGVEMYTRADPSVKMEALEAMIVPKMRSVRFKTTDKLIGSH